MSRGPYPIILMLAMSLPSAARAIGLGDIRVDSALNEPLSAQIDIVGATRDELAALTAKVASREVFQRYGADRPSFLSSATFKVGIDAQGRPVLNIRSSDAFTDPLVSFLVDLRWGNGELVREYSLLLDPPGFPSSSRATEAAYAATGPATPAAPAPTPVLAAHDAGGAEITHAIDTRPVSQAATVAAADTGPAHHRITSHDTLRAIARRTGARNEIAIQRTMIALFRANPHAFDGSNINRLRLGAVLDMPTAAEVEAIPAVEAKREVRAHMTAWRLDGRPAAVRRVADQPAATSAPALPAPAAAPAPQPERVAREEPADAAINSRLQTLEAELDQVHKQLAADNAKIQDLKHAGERAAAAAEPQEVPSSSTVQAAEAAPSNRAAASAAPGWLGGKSLIGGLAAGMGLLVAGFVYLRRRKPTIEPHPYDVIAAEEHLAKLAVAETAGNGISPPMPVSGAAAPPPRPVEAVAPETAHRPPIIVTKAPTPAPTATNETTVSLTVDAEALERSYLDSMAIDSLGIDTSVLDAGTLETAEHPLSDIHAAAARDTTIVDPSALDTTAEHDSTGLETIVTDAADLDAEIDREALNTAVLDVKTFDAAAAQPALDYNLLDLDATGQHVEMPSKLHERVEVSERRTNIADVLKAAIERDPYRRDLRMKLLETYYSAASLNQRAFLEIVRKASRDRDFLSAEDWAKVRAMGREIAAGDPLFDASSKEDDLADCA